METTVVAPVQRGRHDAPTFHGQRHVLSVADFEKKARRYLPRAIFGFVSGAAEDGRSHEENRRAFERYALKPRILVDVSNRSQSVELFGTQYATPFAVAPVGVGSMAAYRYDLVVARAAQDAGAACVLSGSSLIRLEEVAAQSPQTWFQAYLPGNSALIAALVERVAEAGFKTLVVTVDIPVSANRENNVRNGFSTPLKPGVRLAWDGITHPRWLIGNLCRTLALHGMPHFENSFASRGAPVISPNVLRDFSSRDHFSWHHIADIRKQWKGRLVLKGVLDVRDVLMARDSGVDGVILSNHGGRQLDGAVSPLRVLPEVVAETGEFPVMIDSGFRRGTDVLKAVALGARMVFIGRPFVYAASVGGHAGVLHAMRLLRDEVDRDMAMLGVNTLRELSAASLVELRP